MPISMRAQFYVFWLAFMARKTSPTFSDSRLLSSDPVEVMRATRSPQVTELIVYEPGAVPGIDTRITAGSWLKVAKPHDYEATKSPSATPDTFAIALRRSASKGRSMLRWARSKSKKVDSSSPQPTQPPISHHVFLDAEQQKIYLSNLAQDEPFAYSPPNLGRFLRDYSAIDRLLARRQVLLQRSVGYLLEAQDMHAVEVAAWVEQFTFLTHPSNPQLSSLAEAASIVYCFYSLLDKYRADHHVTGYLNTAIELVADRLQKRIRSDSDIDEAWTREILSPDSGLSKPMKRFQTFTKLVSYETILIKPTLDAIEHADEASVIASLPKLKECVLVNRRSFSAQTKTASIVLLYHLATSTQDWIQATGIPQKASEVLHELSGPNYLFYHDSQLVHQILNKEIPQSNVRGKAKVFD